MDLCNLTGSRSNTTCCDFGGCLRFKMTFQSGLLWFRPVKSRQSNISHTFCKRSLCTSHRATQELPKNASSGASIFGAWAFALDSSSVSSFLSNRLKIPSSSKALAFFLFTGALLLFGIRIWVAGRTGSQKPLDQEHQERPQTEAQTTSKQSKQPTFWREQPSNDGETFWVMVKSLCQIMSEWPLFPWWFRLWNASHLAPFPEMKAKSATWKKLEAVTSCYSGFSATHRYTPYINIYIHTWQDAFVLITLLWTHLNILEVRRRGSNHTNTCPSLNCGSIVPDRMFHRSRFVRFPGFIYSMCIFVHQFTITRPCTWQQP